MKKARKKKKPQSYKERSYRKLANVSDLISTKVRIEETDLHILADHDVTDIATERILQYRAQLEKYIIKNPGFSTSLIPLPVDRLAPPMVRGMMQAAVQAEVGPMAAVAGAVAEYVGLALLQNGCTEVVVENGGDIFVSRKRDCTVAIFAGESPLSYKVGVRLPARDMPVGICTSSGTVGHSLSFGDADSVTVVAASTLVADAAATRIGNEVGHGGGGKSGIENGLQKAAGIEGIGGLVIICGELMGASGDVELVKIEL